MGFADRYVDTVSRACTRAQSEKAIDSRLRYRLMDFQIKQAMAAVQIAAGSRSQHQRCGHGGACFAHP